jgi:uncharacterized coiled-coil protein SlyX
MAGDEQLEALEFKLAHLERGLQELSDVVVRQQQDLDQLRERSRQLAEQLGELRGQAGTPEDPHEVPPHY